jgi:FkbM family methyltransferase
MRAPMPPKTADVAESYALLRAANRLQRRWPALYAHLYGAYKRATDRAELRLVRDWVRPGMICVDVGANIGFYTAELARRVGPSGRVFAFEPDPTNAAMIRRRRLGPQAILHEAAVGDEPGETALYLSDDLNVDHRTYPTGSARRQLRVSRVSLDEVLGDAEVDFVKMDIQGHELRALQGMTGVLRRSSRLRMVLEFWPWGIRQAGDDPREVLALLRAAECTLERLDGKPVDEFVESPTWYVNLIARRARAPAPSMTRAEHRG